MELNEEGMIIDESESPCKGPHKDPAKDKKETCRCGEKLCCDRKKEERIRHKSGLGWAYNLCNHQSMGINDSRL